MFPVMGSIFLFGLYLIFKLLPQEYVNIVVKVYFALLGAAVLFYSLDRLARMVFGESVLALGDKVLVKFRLPFYHGVAGAMQRVSEAFERVFAALEALWSKPEAARAAAQADVKAGAEQDAADKDLVTVTPLGIVSLVLSVAATAWYVATGHWAANNLFGIIFSIQALEKISVGSVRNGAIMLCGLFVYDVFWVFGTDVMVTVARKFDAPIKLLFPRPDTRPSLLGLGDIVIPGLFLSLLRRFDHRRARVAGGAAATRPLYFVAGLVGYWLGLSTTLFVMYAFDAAQPALLYLVPTCLLAPAATALVRGELRELAAFEEAEHSHASEPAASAAAAAGAEGKKDK
jgi:minor histocompatibility antigen H13